MSISPRMFEGEIGRGSGNASASWNWPEIATLLDDEAIHRGTLNVFLEDYDSFAFSCEIDFPSHRKLDEAGTVEGLQFQRCTLQVGDLESHAFIVKTANDFWGQYNRIEVIAPFIETAKDGQRVIIVCLN